MDRNSPAPIRIFRKKLLNSAGHVRGPREVSRDTVMSERIPLQTKLSVILTDKCNIECRHCMPECSPEKSRTLSWVELERVIRDASTLPGMQTLCFTGGEVFMFPNLLARCIKLGSQLGLETTAITNGFWARSPAIARRMLERFPGLTRLAVSTDTFHQEFIDIDRIKNAIAACNELGIDCAVRICHLDNPDEEIEAVRTQLADYSGQYEIEHQPVQPIGRAEFEIDRGSIFSYDTKMAVCRSADVHALNPSGRLTACCGGTGDWAADHPLDFGDVREQGLLQTLGLAERSLALHAVRLWGPAGLFRLAADQAALEGPMIPDPQIRNICELCRYVVADEVRAGLLRRALQRPSVRREIAMARLVELGEVASFDEIEREEVQS